MNAERSDFDRTLRAWFADGPTVMSDRVVEGIADRIARQPQRRSSRLRGRSFVNGYTKLAAGLAAVLIAGFVGWRLLPATNPPGGQPSPTPTTAPLATPGPTPGPTAVADVLAGTWTSAPSTCADQNAAIQRAGITAEQLTLAGWDAATCIGMTHGIVHEIRFEPGVSGRPAWSIGRLLQLADGEVGWDGFYQIVDADTFRAGDPFGVGVPYLTYTFSNDGDQLVIDMIEDVLPAQTQAELWGDIVAQTVIYESGPFTRQ